MNEFQLKQCVIEGYCLMKALMKLHGRGLDSRLSYANVIHFDWFTVTVYCYALRYITWSSAVNQLH